MLSDRQTYDSRDLRFKRPYGAVPSGRAVSLTLRPKRAYGFSRAVLTARYEFDDNRTITVSMPWRGLEGVRDLFSCTLPTDGYVGLVWYSFRLEGLDGRAMELGEYQLTVYDDSEAVPAWFGQGVTYQIFPDRFRRTRVPDPTGMVGGRSVHTSWEEEPVYRPDARGEIRNRDFFGGDLAGVMEKLPYLKSLGVETLYFCPIFEAAENHRYGTGDYEKIDPMLGTNEQFQALCQQAHALGMRVLLDGVFNHTGFVSRYFNGDGSYQGPVPGAAQSRQSPYYPWYNFSHWPNRYDSWWGIYSLPAVNESDPTYVDYIVSGKDSIVRRWLRAGADGWRLDVADELPDEFVHALHTAVRETKPDGVVIGEVWEDGSNKIAYGVRRKHILGGHCDGLMNYPFRNALIDFLLGKDARFFMEAMEGLRANYPPFAYYSAMNSMGTHDTARILTLLGVGSPCQEYTKSWRADYRMTPEQSRRGMELLRMGALVLYTFPGSPTVYYGDEAGIEGFEDPFNRRPYPWGRENGALIRWFTRMGQLRHQFKALRQGDISYLRADGHVLAFQRALGKEKVLVAVNVGDQPVEFRLPWPARDVLSGEICPIPGTHTLTIQIPARFARVLIPIPIIQS